MSAETTCSRMDMICAELGRYGIVAEPSPDNQWALVVRYPALALSASEATWSATSPAEVFVSDQDLLRADCLEIVIDKVTSIVGHPC